MRQLQTECDFEPKTVAEAFLQQEMRKMYTFAEIQHAWEESCTQGDWFEFLANLGVRTQKADSVEAIVRQKEIEDDGRG